ncbi:MAG: ABC transporter permease [Candidatus Acidiferrum sp.]
MNLLYRIRSTIRAMLHRQRVEREMDVELRFHLEAYAEDLVRSGMLRTEALRRARMEFGGIEQTKEVCRDARGVNLIESFAQDVRFGLRMLRKSPGFTAVAVLTLALGIGANTAIFTVINAVMLRALPVQHPEELVTVGDPARVHSSHTGTPSTNVLSYPLYREVRDNNVVFSSVLASSHLSELRIKIDGGPEDITGRLVTENYFQTLGVSPLLGRTFSPEEGKTPGGDPFLVISYLYWQRRFAGDPSVVGRKVRLNNYPLTIIGVAPPGFFGEVVGDHADVWAPMMMQPQLMPERGFLEDANAASLLLIGRLKPGFTVTQVQANVNAVVERALTVTLDAKLSADDRDAIRNMKIAVPVSPGSRGLSRVREEFATPLLLLMAMVLLVLLVACVNVANLMLARSATRQREIAIRFAMGAAAARIVRQLLTESLVLAALGGALGLLLAHWGSGLLVSLVYESLSSERLSLGIDWRVLAFTAAICLVAAMVFGLAPAFRVLHVKLERSLKEGGRDFGSGSKGRVQYFLAASQIALGVLVLIAASLLVRSLRNLEEFDLGYSRDQLLLVPVDLFSGGYRGAAIQNATQEVLLRFARLPGVRSVSASANGLFNGNESSDSVRVDGATFHNEGDSQTADDEVGPSYFSTIGVPLILGREITQQDLASAARVAVVNESFAKFFFGEGNPIGRMVHIQDSSRPNQAPYQIIGVCRDVRDHEVRQASRRRMYAPLTSADFDEHGTTIFEVRAAGNPEMLLNSVRNTVREMNADLVIGSVETGGELVTDSLTSQILVAKLSTFFGGLVLLLVCVGLYGGMAYNVAARTKEIGLRMALGAPRRDLMWMVMRETWMVLLIGLAVGIPVGIGATALFQAMLFNISKSDPFSIGSAIVALVVICLTAAIVPVRRATRVDPMVALRYE